MEPGIAPCPFCGSERCEVVQLERHQWAVVCLDCGASGPIADIPQKARAAWMPPPPATGKLAA